MSSLAVRINFEPQRSLAYTGISGTYAGVGTSLVNPVNQFFVQNLTNALLQFSFDAINDHFVLPSNGFFLNDISSNKALANMLYLPVGKRLYVKTIGTPTSGSVYFTVMYGQTT